MARLSRFTFMVFTCIIISVGTYAHASSPDGILGVWNTEDREARVEIYKCGIKKYCGKIIWLLEPDYPAGSEEGTPGTPKLDKLNPDPELRNKPIVGLPILLDFVSDGDNSWKNGRIYDLENGKTYSGKMTLISPDRLDLRGFIGISLFGGTTTWTR